MIVAVLTFSLDIVLLLLLALYDYFNINYDGDWLMKAAADWPIIVLCNRIRVSDSWLRRWHRLMITVIITRGSQQRAFRPLLHLFLVFLPSPLFSELCSFILSFSFTSSSLTAPVSFHLLLARSVESKPSLFIALPLSSSALSS
jgi:hypothetical protein